MTAPTLTQPSLEALSALGSIAVLLDELFDIGGSISIPPTVGRIRFFELHSLLDSPGLQQWLAENRDNALLPLRHPPAKASVVP